MEFDTKFKVLVCDRIDPKVINLLKNQGFIVDYEPEIDQEILKTKVHEYEGLIVRGRTKVRKEIIDAASKLKVVGRVGVGLDNIEVEYAKAKGVKIVAAPEAPTTSVAELAVALMLSVLRNIPYADNEMKNDNWVKGKLLGTELAGKTVGVIGAGGRIGFKVARILRSGFNAKVIGYDIVDLKDKAQLIGIEVEVNLDKLLSKSDIITIHVPYIPQTHHLLNRERISIMKEGSILINTSRGDLIEGPAVLEAIKKGRLSGIGLDVFHKEPPVDDWEKELIRLPNGQAVCTCHIGSQTLEAQKRASMVIAEKIVEVLKLS